ncbi:salicylate synthase [Micromonospora echinofusca]|uniref:salicylate synthase n=1 Tax=Micromonospora echinofusca TaxID=47858 RepID=UPI002020F9FC|nr:salicylate synthase [Micromonospora sp. MSM11]MCL7456316.1 salicylate synthase [Micromonospora sp. MSM11]
MAGHRKYHERTIAPVGDPLAAAGLLVAVRQDRDHVCYEGPEGYAVAVDPVAEVIADRRRLVVRTDEGRRTSPFSAEALRGLPTLLDEVSVDAWRCYGWAGFELAAARDGLVELLDDEPFLHLMIPRVEVRFHANGTLLRALDVADLDAVQADLEKAPPVRPPGQPTPVDDWDAEGYLYAVDRAMRTIRSGRLQKVILSRTVPVAFPVDLPATYRLGRQANTPARSYLLRLGGLAATGFSPETVVEVARGWVTTQPVAGTRARTGHEDIDEPLRQELLTDPKEVYEHAISVKVAVDELAELCPGAPVEIPEFMAVRQRGSVQHLASTVRSPLAATSHAWDAFSALFPAVTTSGVPKRAAYEVIHELEPSARGLYGGAVLTYDSDGAMDAAVALRTVYQRDGRTWLQVGAGIVGTSLPERELTETREKLATIARYLVAERPDHAAGERRGQPSTATREMGQPCSRSV